MLPVIAAAVVQITNGFFFAEMPYRFSRPVFPEVSGLQAQTHGKYARASTWTNGVVDLAIKNGAAFNGKLRIENRAFADRRMRHENLLWLSEVAGERLACHDTSIGRYEPLDMIDAFLAASNREYLVESQTKKDAISAFSLTYAETSEMQDASRASSALAAGINGDMETCLHYLDIVENLAFVYTWAAGGHAATTNRAAVALEERGIASATGITNLLSLALTQAESISNAVAWFAETQGLPQDVARLSQYVADGRIALSEASNALQMMSRAAESCNSATPYLDDYTNAEDRAYAVMCVRSAQTSIVSATNSLAICADSLSAMRFLSKGISDDIHDAALDIGNRYIRTPAYFCSHSSVIDLFSAVNAATNLFTHIGSGAFFVETDQSDAARLGDDYAYYASLGIGRMSTNNFASPPRYGAPFSAAQFVLGASNLTEHASRGASFVPLEHLADTKVVKGNRFSMTTYERSRSCDTTYHYYATQDPNDLPTNAYQLTVTNLGSPDYPTESVVIYTTTNDATYVFVTNDYEVTGVVTPESPASFRDIRINYFLDEYRYCIWAVSEWLSPFPGLRYSQGSGLTELPVMITNRQETVEIDSIAPDDGEEAIQNLDSFSFRCFTPSVLTRGRSLPVKTICSVSYTIPNIGVVTYFRTNAYSIAVSRARGAEDDVVKIQQDGEVSDDSLEFVTLVADVLVDEYSVLYSGWSDYHGTSGDHDWHRKEGDHKRMLVPVKLRTRCPDDDGYFAFSVHDVVGTVRDTVLSKWYEDLPANFYDVASSYEPPPYMPTEVYTYDVKSFTAYMTTSLQMSITNLFVAANLEFTQGTTAPVDYLVPGYRHLDGLPPPCSPLTGGDGWIGPFDMREGQGGSEALARFRAAYEDLIVEQTNSIPETLIWDVYNYELRMVPSSWGFMGEHPESHDTVLR